MRRPGFLPGYAVTNTKIFITGRSTGRHRPASSQPVRPPTKRAFSARLGGFGTKLSPDHLRSPRSRLVRYYALFKGWLLLSLPSSCFRPETPCRFALSFDLGTLTTVPAFPVMAH